MRYDIKSWDDLLYASNNCDEQDRLVFFLNNRMIRTRVEFNERVGIDIITDDPGTELQEQLKRSIGEFGMRNLEIEGKVIHSGPVRIPLYEIK